MDNKLSENLEGLIGKLEGFVTTKTVVGEPIHIDNTILVPLVDVSFAAAAGSTASNHFTERKKEKEKKVDGGTDAGAGGIGAKITPSAMLVIQNGTTQLINIKGQDSITKLIDMIPGFVSKVPDFVSKFTPHADRAPTQSEKNTTSEASETYHQMEE